MKDFTSESELPKGSVIGWEMAYKTSGFSKHYVMRHFYMGDFPKPIGRVALRNKKNHKHWAFVFDMGAIKEWSAKMSLIQGVRK